MSTPEIIFFFKSTYYPDFRQKILSILSLPNGLIQFVEYDEKWLSDDIKLNLNKAKNISGLVIFLDYSKQNAEFYPIRRCKVSEIIPPTIGVTYQIILSMEDFVNPVDTKKFNDDIRTILSQKKMLSKATPNSDEYLQKLVLKGADPLVGNQNSTNSQQEIWEETAKMLARADPIARLKGQEQFSNSIFFRTNILLRTELKSQLSIEEHSFKISQGRPYAVSLSAFNPDHQKHNNKPNKKITISVDDKLISHVGSSEIDLPMAQDKYTKYFDFQTKETLTSESSEIVVTESDENFETPSIKLPYKLMSKRLEVYSLIVSMIAGILLIGIAATFPNDIVTYFKLSNNYVTILTFVFLIVGSFLSGIPLVWLEIKKRTL